MCHMFKNAFILLMLLTAPLYAYVISREGSVTHGVNQYGNHYFYDSNAGTVEYINKPGNEYYNQVGEYYLYVIPYGENVTYSLDNKQYTTNTYDYSNQNTNRYQSGYTNNIYAPVRYKQPKKSISFWEVIRIIGIASVILSVLYQIIKGLL